MKKMFALVLAFVMFYVLIININAKNINLEGTLFLGDSLTVGINSTVELEKFGADVEAKIGRSVHECYKSAQNYSGYSKVIIAIGTNDYNSDDKLFVRNYTNLINQVIANNPNATIYLSTIPGCNETVAKKTGYKITNSKINNKNQLIKQIAEENKIKIIDTNQLLGSIMPDDTIDGIHMKEHIYEKWFDIIVDELFPKKKVFVLSFETNSIQHQNNLQSAFEHYFKKQKTCDCSICEEDKT